MNTQATSTTTIKNWDEKSFHELTGAGKLTRVSVTKTYQGDIEGEGTLEYLMAYGLDNLVTFVGLERIVGRIRDRSGSFVIQISGVFTGGVPDESFLILPNSASDELVGMRGRGRFSAGPTGSYHINLDYEFTQPGNA